MSPHAVLEPESQASRLAKFGVTQHGFLPATAPADALQSQYYSPWESLAAEISSAIEDGTIRDKVDHLPVLSTYALMSEAEWRRAYLIMAYFAQAYIWGGEKPAEVLPESISRPYLETARHLELPPTLAYAASNLWNFSSTNGNFSDVESLKTLLSFTGTDDESWFLMISVAMEAQTASIVPAMMMALDCVKTRELDTISKALEDLSSCIDMVGCLLERMDERCDPDVFFNQIRPFLAGSKNMGAVGLPNGVFYDAPGDPDMGWKQLRGGSNGQSSIIQFFDIVLGITHTNQGNATPNKENDEKSGCGINRKPNALSFHEEVRYYMPGPHRRFLEYISRMGSIRELAMLPVSNPEQQRLLDAYKLATDSLVTFRNKHIQLVTRYIVLPSRRKDANMTVKRQNLASATTMKVAGEDGGNQAQEITGTGGTTLIPFLKQARDETAEAGELTREVAIAA